MQRANSRRLKRRVLAPEGVAVRRSQAGLGLFATRPYKRGETVIEYVGRIVSKEEEYTSKSKYLFEVHRGKTIDGKPRWNIAGYINHSCRPNCEPILRKGRIFIKTRRAIRAGEEFTYDYGEEYVAEHIRPRGCRCHHCLARRG